MLEAMRATGISDVQSIALIKSIIWQTYAQLHDFEQVTWPYIGRWEIHYAGRTVFNVPASEVLDPDTGIMTIETVEKSPMNKITLRPNWRKGLKL